jgi:hypothetical protein
MQLDDSDVDIKALTIFVRGGKGGKEALVTLPMIARRLSGGIWKSALLSILMDVSPCSIATSVDDGKAIAFIACSCNIKSSQESKSMAEFMSFLVTASAAS